jgi:hypothetical protein
MNEPLFRMNEHGDIWQEPSLYDAPQEWTVSAPARPHHLEEWHRGGPDALGRVVLTSQCHACRPDVGDGPRTFVTRGATLADAWRAAETAHSAHLDMTTTRNERSDTP